MGNITRRRLLAATTAFSLGIVSGCSTIQDTAGAPPAEGTTEAPATGDETNSDVPETESADTTNGDTTDTAESEPEPKPTLPPEVNDLYTRVAYSVDERRCGQIEPYTRVLRSGMNVVFMAGRWAEQRCEQFTFVNEEYDEDTSTLKLYVEWGVNGNEGCGAECARGKVLSAAYDLDYDVKELKLYLAENGDEAKLVESWWR